jgi:hypothetical protein
MLADNPLDLYCCVDIYIEKTKLKDWLRQFPITTSMAPIMKKRLTIPKALAFLSIMQSKVLKGE